MPDPLFLDLVELFLASVYFIFGAMIGSFLNVCIHRMPLEQSLSHPPSHCPKCGYSIPWYFNIPILAWIRLRGRCGNCAEPISIRYPAVELLTGIAFAAAWLAFRPDALHAAILCLLLAGFIVATFIDFDYQIIPDEITIGGMGAGLACSLIAPQLHATDSRLTALGQSLIGLAVGFGLVYIVVRAGKAAFGKQTFEVEDERLTFTEEALVFSDGAMPYEEIFYRKSDTITLQARQVELVDRCYFDTSVALTMEQLTIGAQSFNPEDIRHLEVATDEVVIPREAMGFGDVKFMGAIGAFLGWSATVFSLMASAIIGSVVGITMMLLKKEEWAGRLPYGPYIALAAVIWIFGGDQLWEAWWKSVNPPPP
ncbi:MAG: prepilin peptidase [Verrucomicrobiales bacterium]|nr:prepilin peptidase [Verrucomicrobiales bacterium]|tara:strand:- start:17951 stop:19054 length:1104 start_codon:yes stop_codon:yes gene_type:complete